MIFSSSKTTQDTSNAVQQASQELVDSASQTLDKAENKVRELRGNVEPVVDLLATRAQKLARHGLDIASQAKDRTQQSLSRAAGATTRYVSEQPVRSVLMAAAVGAAVAWLVSANRDRR